MYDAGMGANLYRSAEIYDSMLQYWRYPEALFTGSEERRAFMRSLLQP
jgi:hypothetical protein